MEHLTLKKLLLQTTRKENAVFVAFFDSFSHTKEVMSALKV